MTTNCVRNFIRQFFQGLILRERTASNTLSELFSQTSDQLLYFHWFHSLNLSRIRCIGNGRTKKAHSIPSQLTRLLDNGIYHNWTFFFWVAFRPVGHCWTSRYRLFVLSNYFANFTFHVKIKDSFLLYFLRPLHWYTLLNVTSNFRFLFYGLHRCVPYSIITSNQNHIQLHFLS